MLQVLMIYDGEFEKPVWIDDLGYPNSMPTPWRDSTLSEYKDYSHCTPDFIEYRKITEPALGGVNIHWFDDCAFIVRWPPSDSNLIRYIRIGCDHDFQISYPAMFETKYTCLRCGYTLIVDSSP